MDVKKKCSVDGCDRRRFTRLYCGMHYARWKKSGDPGPAGSLRGNYASQFAAKTQANDNGCLLWTAGLTKDGYGKFNANGKCLLAHRWAYEQARGPVPEGLELDHLCRTRSCVNVDHLEAVTPRVNRIRGVGFAGQNARKTHCPQGHPYSGDNLYVLPSGGRVCRTCNRAKSREYRRRRASA